MKYPKCPNCVTIMLKVRLKKKIIILVQKKKNATINRIYFKIKVVN